MFRAEGAQQDLDPLERPLRHAGEGARRGILDRRRRDRVARPQPDDDGIVRRQPLHACDGDKLLALAREAVARGRGRERGGNVGVQLAGRDRQSFVLDGEGDHHAARCTRRPGFHEFHAHLSAPPI